MADAPQELRRVHWAEVFGFTQLFRAFRLAINPTMLILAMCGVILSYATGRVMDKVWPAKYCAVRVGGLESELDVFVAQGEAACKWRQDVVAGGSRVERVGPFALFFAHVRCTLGQATDAVSCAKFGDLTNIARSGAMGKLWLFAMHPVYGVIFGVANLLIWAFFGGAMCRVAALQATRDDRPDIRQAMAFARKKFLSFVAAPLLPIGLLVVVTILLYIGGLVGAIKGLGDIVVPLVFFLALLGGFVMAFLIVGSAAGFSLFYPTVAIEGSDAFDALSRSFSYVYQRPWRTAFYSLVSLCYGAICLLFVKYFVQVMLAATYWAVGLSMNYGSPFLSGKGNTALEGVGKLKAMWHGPSLTGPGAFYGDVTSQGLGWPSAFGHVLICFWVFLVVGLVGAFVISLYYSSSTLIYLLLRREVDATDLEDVYLEDQPEEQTAAPSPAPPAPSGPPAAPPPPENPPVADAGPTA